MGPDGRSSIGRRRLAIVDSNASLATVKAVLWRRLKGPQKLRGLQPGEYIWPDRARCSFKEELIHSSGDDGFRYFRSFDESVIS